jgi:hypothetical protein
MVESNLVLSKKNDVNIEGLGVHLLNFKVRIKKEVSPNYI